MIGSIGYISEVVKVFSSLKISLDAIATTETSFSLSLRKKDYTEKLLEELEKIKEFFHLEVFENITKISLIGANVNEYDILEDL
jgi:aspartokinase